MKRSPTSPTAGPRLSRLRQCLDAKSLALLTAAGIVNAFGVMCFLSPVALYDSGFSGTAMLLSQLTGGVPLSVFLLLLNVPLFLYGLKRQGLVFTVRSIYAVTVYSVASLFFGRLTGGVPASPVAGADLLLCAVFGGMISGAGSGLTIRYGGAIDGMEVLAVIFARGLGLTVGAFVMAYNAVLYVVAGMLMGNWALPLYSILTYMAGIRAVDFIVEGLDKTKAAMIVTSRAEEICRELSSAFRTGITLINARGYYSSEEKTIVYFVVNRFQIAKLRGIVHGIDENAFISITEVSDLFGKSLK